MSLGCQTVGKVALPVLESLGQLLEFAAAQEQRGLHGLREVILAAVQLPTIKQQVANVLARQVEPVLARDVQDLVSASFPSQEAPTVAEVRSVLSGNPEFIQPENHRWQFGRLAAPWRP